MADPIKYDPDYSYSGFQAVNPTRPLPADEIDNDFAKLAQASDEAVDAIMDIRRSDGALKNEIVTIDSLDPEVKYLMSAQDLDIVIDNMENIAIVAMNIAPINTVAINIVPVVAVGQNIDAVLAANANMPAIIAAPVKAAEAAASATQAGNYAAASEASKVLSGQSATVSQTQATNSQNSATASAASAAAAAASKTGADASAANSQASAVASQNSATAAQGSVTAAAAQVALAAGHADDASDFADAAAASAASAADKVPEAPNDGQQYARQNRAWAVVTGGGGGGGGIPEAPTDGKTYGRNNAAWVDITATLLASYLPLAGGTLTGQLKAFKGTGPAPGISFSDEPGSGLYWASAGIIRMVMGGTTVQEYQTTNRATLFYGKATMVASAAARASITLPHGAAPTAPVDGDMWTTTTALFCRINGVTKQYPTLAEIDAAYLKLSGGTMTGDLVIQKTDVRLLLDKTSGYSALAGSVAGKFRWSLQLGNNEAETGGNAGSNFNFDRYADDGNYLGTALNINRATGDMLTQGNMTWDKANPDLILNKKASGQGIRIASLTANKNRWWLHFGNNEGESGGNAGSNIVLYAYDDAGNDLGEALRIQRATLATTFKGDVTVNKASPTLQLQKTAATQDVSIFGMLNGLKRWGITLGSQSGETGANAGSNFNINRFDDAGVVIPGSAVMSIRRDNGDTQIAGNLQVNKSNPIFAINRQSVAEDGLIRGTVNNSPRWAFGMGDQTAEGGANAGSNWYLARYSDAGAWLDNVLYIVRSAATVSGTLIASYGAYWANTLGKLLTVDTLWNAAVPVSVAYAASITLNLNNGINFLIPSITGALTLNNPTGIKAGQSGFIRLSSTGGGFALAFGTAFYFPTGTKPTAMGNNNDMIYYQAVDTGVLFCSYVKSYTNA